MFILSKRHMLRAKDVITRASDPASSLNEQSSNFVSFSQAEGGHKKRIGLEIVKPL